MLNKKIYLGMQQVMGSRVGRYYREFRELEQARPERLEALHRERLQLILQHAAEQVPYYRERVGRRNRYELSDFPVLTKEDIRENFERLMADDFRRRFRQGEQPSLYNGWRLVKTSGSTGQPITVIHDKEMRERGRAGRLYCLDLGGLPFGVPHYKLWCNLVDLDASKNVLMRRVTNRLARPVFLNAYFLQEERLKRYLEIINNSRLDRMLAYADAAYQLALYAQRKEIKVRPLKLILATATTLTPSMRQTLREVFGAEVRNQYGSTDCANIAVECSYGGFHILDNNLHVEAVDSEGRPAAPGVDGRLLVTQLFNFSFPLIRYNLGDVGSLEQGLCACGRPWPLLGQVTGRQIEMLVTPGGGYISPAVINSLLGEHYVFSFIRRYQLVQTAGDAFELRLEVEPATPEESFGVASLELGRRLGMILEPGRLLITRVERIAPSSSGKHMPTLNLMGA